MVESTRTWWGELNRIEKSLRAGLALIVVLWGFLVGFDRIYQTPARLDRAELRITTLEVADATQTRQLAEVDRRLEWLVCDGLVKQGIAYHGRITAQECAADLMMGTQQP